MRRIRTVADTFLIELISGCFGMKNSIFGEKK